MPAEYPHRQSFVCGGNDGCPEHEPPDPDCWKCTKAFWDARLPKRLLDGGGQDTP